MLNLKVLFPALFFITTWLIEAQVPEINVRRDIIKVLTHWDEAEYRPKVLFETKEMPLVETESHTDLQFVFEKRNLVLKLFYDAEAVRNPKLLLPDAVFFGCIRSPGCLEMKGVENTGSPLLDLYGPVTSIYGINELFYDAKKGNISAQTRLLRWRLAVLEQMSVTEAFETQFTGTRVYLQNLKLSETQKLLTLFQSAQSAEQKALIDFKEANRSTDAKLADLILNNDRKGVAQYLRTVLSWELMQEAEANSWKLWIDAIENPNLSETTLAFRGMSHLEEALTTTIQGEVRRAFLSPMLNRNLSNIDESIKGLTEKRVTFGDRERSKLNVTNPETIVRTSDMMTSHTEADNGLSMFLSFSPDIEVAEHFVSGTPAFPGPAGNLLAVRIDKRRLFPNIATGFPKEFEFIAPLIVFPDEIIIYKENYDLSESSHNEFVEFLENRGEDIQENLEQYYNGNFYLTGFDFLQQIQN